VDFINIAHDASQRMTSEAAALQGASTRMAVRGLRARSS
jgi:hypothetical protein